MNLNPIPGRLPARLAGLVYSLFSYGLFLLSVLYLIGFLGRVAVPKHIDDGMVIDDWLAALINLSLLLLFAVQHTVMARKGFKAWITRYISTSVERSTYVLLSSLVLILIFWLWQPMPSHLWTLDGALTSRLSNTVFWLGWGLILIATFQISHFELFGLRQAIDRFQNTAPRAPTLKTPTLYKLVRHPLYLGFLIVFWATPDMSAGRLLFALGMSIYLFIGVRFEERDLVDLFGEEYRRYQKKVGMVLPRLGSGERGKKT
ncbi:methanethiol S-methyltransferase [Pseudomonas gessardii]|uniref:methanethiol S-methyltransferase n=1 Tax=Pseudomonas gessardii TaxID=78544 RepID=A0A7Y1MPB2_9PSED|nr:methanethiol S-methyltransferase [Pseudomonas gessardii]NNA95557.1 isoprenylcysteine carboxylmethyltransferase family protein [Pseudomonas gessardii]